MNPEHQYDRDRTTIGLMVLVLEDKEVKLTSHLRRYFQQDLRELMERHTKYIGNGKSRPLPALSVAYQVLNSEPQPSMRKEIAESLRDLIGASY